MGTAADTSDGFAGDIQIGGEDNDLAVDDVIVLTTNMYGQRPSHDNHRLFEIAVSMDTRCPGGPSVATITATSHLSFYP
jgi:hypothetical protein